MILYTSREYWIFNRHEDYLTDILLTSDFQTLTELRARLSWRMRCPGLLLTSHTLSSLLILYPSLALVTVLVTRARVLDTLNISTAAIFPVSYLSYVFLPSLALILALSILIVRPFHRADRVKGEVLKGTIMV